METARDAMEVPTLIISDAPSSDASSTFSHKSDRREVKNVINDDCTSKLSLVVEALNETIAEESARAREITELLNDIGVETKNMPKHIQDTWNKVSAIMKAEGLPDVDEVSLKIIMEQRRREKMRKVREERRLKSRYDELCRLHSDVLERQNVTREAAEDLQKFIESESTKNEEKYADRIFMAIKLHDYRRTAEKLDEDLKTLVKNECYPDKILEKYEYYLSLAEESKKLDEELKKYEDLPPNLSEARIMVEEKEKYLKDLENAIYEKMHRS